MHTPILMPGMGRVNFGCRTYKNDIFIPRVYGYWCYKFIGQSVTSFSPRFASIIGPENPFVSCYIGNLRIADSKMHVV